MSSLERLGEREVIKRLARFLPSREDVKVHVGDDTAVVSTGDTAFDWLLTSDPVIEGVHFTGGTPARSIGHKAVGRILSDIAAMGGEPLWMLINLVAPRSTLFERIEEIYQGVSDLAGRYGVAVVGGDTSQGPVLEVHVFGVGQVPRDSAILRTTARTGDLIFVTGRLGGSRLDKHVSFEPRITEGLWLHEQSWPSSLIDVTDGLVNDLRHIMEGSGVGAEIRLADIPLSEDAHRCGGELTPLEHALCDGEDFELLFTVPAGREKIFPGEWAEQFETPCTCIGVITDRVGELQGIDAQGRRQPLTVSGYEHFKP